MGDVPGSPAVVLVATTLAAVLLLIEAALPTFGIAGASAFLLGVVAVIAAEDSDAPWWPLLLVVGGVVMWTVLIVMRRPPTVEAQVVAGALFGSGCLLYAVLAEDAASVVVALAGSIAAPLVFPRLHRSARRLADLPPQVGMEALVGRIGVVTRAVGNVGTVQLDGSFWNVRSDAVLTPGSYVVVTAWSGMTLSVAPSAPAAR